MACCGGASLGSLHSLLGQAEVCCAELCCAVLCGAVLLSWPGVQALLRALKTKHETPKYGLIFHASLIGQAPPKFKGKISRVLAAKCALLHPHGRPRGEQRREPGA